jgi:NAD(P)-dependent dehydrogenase (short-subunit alcohol dehydrogenase family)
LNILSGRSVAITGGAQGIGKATAAVCAKQGASVLVCDVNGELAELTAKEINSSGGRAVAVHMDASNRDDCKRMVETAVNAFGWIDGLVCGGMRRFYEPAEEFDDAHWNTVVGQGLTGYLKCSQEAAKQMLPRGSGAIVFITSIASHKAVDGGAAYCSVKAGIAGLTRQLGVEWAGRGVRTNAVAPGFTITEGALRRMSDEEARALIPIGRAARADEIGNVCAFLLSDLASHITGQEIVVDGGYSIGSNFSAGKIRR